MTTTTGDHHDPLQPGFFFSSVDTQTTSWRPTKCERELLVAVEEGRLAAPEEARDAFCQRAFGKLVAQMIADLGTTDPSDADAVADLVERWDGGFLYAWLTCSRSGGAWAEVYAASSWARLVPRRRELADLLRPSLVAKLVQHTADSVGRRAERVTRETQERSKSARTWLANAASRSYQASLDAVDRLAAPSSSSSSADRPHVLSTTKGSFVGGPGLYASVGDVVSGAAGYAARRFGDLRQAAASSSSSSSPAAAAEEAPAVDVVVEKQPTFDDAATSLVATPPPPDSSAGGHDDPPSVDDDEERRQRDEPQQHRGNDDERAVDI